MRLVFDSGEKPSLKILVAYVDGGSRGNFRAHLRLGPSLLPPQARIYFLVQLSWTQTPKNDRTCGGGKGRWVGPFSLLHTPQQPNYRINKVFINYTICH